MSPHRAAAAITVLAMLEAQWAAGLGVAGLLIGAALLPVIRAYVPVVSSRLAGLAVAGTGLLFVLSGWRFGLTWTLPAYLYLASVTPVLAIIDARTKRLPNPLTLSSYPILLALLALPAVLSDLAGSLVTAAIGGVALLVLFVVLHLVNPSGMGMGDVKLSGTIGISVGWVSLAAALWAACAGFLLAAAISLVLLATGRATRKSALPFGPSMLAGAWGVLVASKLLQP